MDWVDDTAGRVRDFRSVPIVPMGVKAKQRVACSAFQASERLARHLQTEEEQRRAQIANDLGVARALAGDHDQVFGNPWGRRGPLGQPSTARTSTSAGRGVPSTTAIIDPGEWSIYGYITSALSWLWGSPTNSQ